MPRGPNTKSKAKTENLPPKGTTPPPKTTPSSAPSKKGIQESSASQLNQKAKPTKKAAQQADAVQESKEAKLEELRQAQERRKEEERAAREAEQAKSEAPGPNPLEHKPPITYLDVNILRKKKSLTRMENERKEKRDKKKLEKRKLPKPMKFVSAEKIVKASRQRSAQSIRIKRTQIKYKYLLEKPAEENKLVVAVRIRGFYGQTTMIKKILHELRLTTVRSAVFLKMTKRVMYLLKLVEPFVTYGTPTLRVVRDLITKRAYINLPGQQQRSPLNDNATIEKHLGELNIVCVEDIVNEIWNCGPAFEQVNKFLEPFKVILPPEGYKNKRDTYAEGGDSGDRGEKINDLLQRIL